MGRVLFALLIAFLGMSSETLCATDAGQPETSNSDSQMMPALRAIVGYGMLSHDAYSDLQELSDNIGARLTGSPGAAEAVDWASGKMRAIGLSNVHTELWQLRHGWSRVSAQAELIAPVRRLLNVDSMGWVGSTPSGGIEAEVVPVDIALTEPSLSERHWNGKIVLVISSDKDPNSNENKIKNFLKFRSLLETASLTHAAAFINALSGTTDVGMQLTHTSSVGFDAFDDVPVLTMATEDQQQLLRFLNRGESVKIKLNVQNRVTSGPVDSVNVIGEIPGAEHPEQVIVVGAHLDSWDLAQGATDNGSGVVACLGAADAIMKSRLRPKRTIRFVLFTGEEQGLVGSRAYVQTHRNELPSYVAAIVIDQGPGPVIGVSLGGRDDLVSKMKPLARLVEDFGAFEIDDRPSFGTDSASFMVAGVPGFTLNQNSPQYKYTHHSKADTLDKVEPSALARNATLLAVISFWIADLPERLAEPWPKARTQRMLIEHKYDELLKSIGWWSEIASQ